MSKLTETSLSPEESAALTEAVLEMDHQRFFYARFGITANINRKYAKGFLTIHHSPLPGRGSIFGSGILSLPISSAKSKPDTLNEEIAEFNQTHLGINPDKAWASMSLSESMAVTNFTLATLKANNLSVDLAIARTFIAEGRSDPNLLPRQLRQSDHSLDTLFKGFNEFIAGLKTALPAQQLTILPANFSA